jgi:GGDEF domain-containing protein
MAETAIRKAEEGIKIFFESFNPLVSSSPYEVSISRGTVVSDAETFRGTFKGAPHLKEFLIGMIPIYGSGRDIVRGWRDDDWFLFSMGCIGLGLDVFTPGVGKAAAKGTFALAKGGLQVAKEIVNEIGEEGLRAFGREVVEYFIRKKKQRELAEMFCNLTKSITGKPIEGGLLQVTKNQFLDISGKMIAWDGAYTSGKQVVSEATKATFEIAKVGARASVVVIDLNWFKLINEIIGRANADEVIKVYENEIEELLKGVKSIGYGREEIIAIVPESAEEVAKKFEVLNANLRRTMEEKYPDLLKKLNDPRNWEKALKDPDVGPTLKEMKDKGRIEISAKIGIAELPVGEVKPKTVRVGGKETVESFEQYQERIRHSIGRKIEEAKSAGEFSKAVGDVPIVYTSELNVQNIKYGRIETKARKLGETIKTKYSITLDESKIEKIEKWIETEKNRRSISSYIKQERIDALKTVKGGIGVYDDLASFVFNAKGTREVVIEAAKNEKTITTVEIASGLKHMRTLKTMNNSREGYMGGDVYIKTVFSNMKDELESQGYKHIKMARFVKDGTTIHLARRGGGDWISFIIEGRITEDEVKSIIDGWRSRMAKDLIPAKGATSQFIAAYGMTEVSLKGVTNLEDVMSVAFKSSNYKCKDMWNTLRGVKSQ